MKKQTVSIILCVFNKEFLIKKVIDSIIENKSNNTKELIIVFDGCTDKSEEIAIEALKNVKDINIIIEHAPNVFETKANNIALKLSTCNYSMIIQDDMLIQEKDFDARMLKPFMFKDTFTVTSRLAHNDYINKIGNLTWGEFAGYDPYNLTINPSYRNIFTIRDICNRGPLLVDNEKIQKLNYFDEIFYPQQYDEHDICFRAWKLYNWVSGSFWIKWYSKEEWGGSRQEVYTENNHDKYEWLETCGAKNKEIIKKRYTDLLLHDNKHNEERLII